MTHERNKTGNANENTANPEMDRTQTDVLVLAEYFSRKPDKTEGNNFETEAKIAAIRKRKQEEDRAKNNAMVVRELRSGRGSKGRK